MSRLIGACHIQKMQPAASSECGFLIPQDAYAGLLSDNRQQGVT
ncbi:MAG: hypothetical protein RHS_3228 [Robinsoniella sp. RHS]|nr:MAG: hypothetical protein RHS_3228 [Robinsoniella sp. RHS]